MNKALHANCDECPLADKPIARTQGPEDAKVAFVSRSPGFHEAQVGKPFSGPSGKVLDHLLAQNGVKRNEILVTNVVLCAPDAGKVPPDAIKCCAARLRHELKDCSLVIAGGSEAVNSIIGRGSIDRYRGYRIDRGNGRTFVATNNPALVLRDDSTFPNLVKDFRRAFNPRPQPPFPGVSAITETQEAKRFVSNLLKQKGLLAADLETRGGLTHKARIVTCQFATDGERATVLSESGHEEGIFQDNDFIDNYLRPLFESREHSFIWHNGIFDTKILQHSYEIDARVDEDTLLLSYCCDERPGFHSLEYLLAEEFAWPDYEPETVKKFKKTGIVEDYEELHFYAGVDAAGTYQLYSSLSNRLNEEGSHRAYKRVLLPAIPLIRAIETNGMVYDIEAAADIYDHEVKPELERIEKQLQEKADNPLLNPRSPKQLSALYYDKWGITHAMQKRPDMQRSVDESARTEILEGRFKVAREAFLRSQGKADEVDKLREHIIEFTQLYDRSQKLGKQAGTYLLGLIERAADDPDSRVYTTLLLHGTTTGRLSSREPNLQNVTRTKEGLPDIRSLFIAPPGSQLVQADYSQAELRCIAQLSKDPELSRIYRENESLHKLVASRFYGPDYTYEQYSNAKNMNFGVAYRQGAETFQEKHGIPEKEAEKFIKWWWKQFPAVEVWEKGVEQEVKTTGHLVSPFGRLRRFHLLTRENINAVFREAINFYPQTTASDLTLTSAIEIYNEVDTKKAKLCLTVHDSILAEVVDDYIQEYITIARQIMVSRAKEAIGWDLPFDAEFGVGPSWGKLEEVASG